MGAALCRLLCPCACRGGGDDDETDGICDCFLGSPDDASDEDDDVMLLPFPRFDSVGDYDGEDVDGARPVHLCRFIPWRLGRCLNMWGCGGCGLRLSANRGLGWLVGTRRGNRLLLILLTLLLIGTLGWVAYSRGRELGRIHKGACYVCNPRIGREDDAQSTDSVEALLKKSHGGDAAIRALARYADHAHGRGRCAIDDTYVVSMDRALTDQWWFSRMAGHNCMASTDKGGSACDAWRAYTLYMSGGPEAAALQHGNRTAASRRGLEPKAVSWRSDIPSVFVIGCRGAGTTSLGEYMRAHPMIRVRRRQHASPTGDGSATVPHNGGKAVEPGDDDHFFSYMTDWTPAELKAWTERGWARGSRSVYQLRQRNRRATQQKPRMRPVRVEVGGDYYWGAGLGTAQSVRRATQLLPRSTTAPEVGTRPKFIVLVADPIRLVKEAWERATDLGVETRPFWRAVADELPDLMRCLVWDGAGMAEQRERLVTGACGGLDPSPGPPYIWHGMASEFLAAWMRLHPGRSRYYFLRSEDLLRQPNRTMNRLAVDFLGLDPFDFSPHTRHIYHPRVKAAKAVAGSGWPGWMASLPRMDYISQIRKAAADALYDAANAALRRAVPGAEATLSMQERIRRYHCRMVASFARKDSLVARQCERDAATPTDPSPPEKEPREHDPTEDETMALLKVFLSTYHVRLMQMAESTDERRVAEHLDQRVRRHRHTPP